MIKIALVGNPNSGKTTLFNTLCGTHQYTGNWPGVTVEKKEGSLKGNKEVFIEDLPGIYSLSPYSPEEIVTREYLLNEHPDVIINIVDASNLERNLYLTSQCLELHLPMVLALNMIDVVNKRGDRIDSKELSKRLGVPVIPFSALDKDGCFQVSREAISQALKKEIPHPDEFSEEVEETIVQAEKIVDQGSDSRWYAIKALEEDEPVLKQLDLDATKQGRLHALQEKLEESFDDDVQSIITDERYQWIAKILQGVYRKKNDKALSLSDKIDQIVTNRILAIPIFILIMGIVYYLSLNLIGTPLTDWVNDVFVAEWLQGGIGSWLESLHASEQTISLIVDGIIGGLGAPLGFLPQMAVMFLCLSFLEDCGYMSRIAFIMDRIFRRFGLSGKSFISFMISTGCGIPGILSTRTIENERDRRMTMIVTTSMPCGAKLPVIAMIAGAVLGSADAWWIGWATYLFGISAIILSALVLKHMRMFAGEPAPFIMELPNYHWPKIDNVLHQTWSRCWHFIKKAGTILFACCVVTWFLVTYGFGPEGFGLVEVQDSLLARIGDFLSFVFAPLGFGNWQAVAASLSGFVAKEQIVATMGTLVNVADDTGEIPQLWMAIQVMFPTAVAAVSFLIFNLLDAPCLAAISTTAKEMNDRKWTWFTIGWQMFFAYTMSLMVYQFGSLLLYGTFGFWTIIAFIVLIWYLYMLFRPVPKEPIGAMQTSSGY